MTFCADHRDHFIDISPALFFLLCLDHDADQRLGTRLSDKNAAGIPQRLRHLLNSGLHIRILLRGRLVLHPDVDQHLRIDRQTSGELAQFLLARHHDLHHLEAGQDAVSRRSVLGENDMAGLLSAQTAAVLAHVFIDVLVADRGFGVADPGRVERLVQAEIGHQGGDDRVGEQLAALLHVLAVDVKDVVAGDDIALFIDAQAAVRIAVVGEADVQPVVHNELLQSLNVRRTGVPVDVEAVRLGVDDIGLGAQRVEHRLCDVPRAAVRAVQTDPHTPERIDAEGDEVADVPVAPGDVVHRAADLLASGIRHLGPFLTEQLQIAVDVVLDERDGLLVHLLALTVDQLDAVVIIRVVARRNHDAAVELVDPGDIRDRGGRGDMQQIGVRAGGGQAGDQRVFKHVARAPRVLADHDAGRFLRARPALPLAVVPAEKAPDLVGVAGGQVFIRFAAEAVRSEVLSHGLILFF